MINCRWGVNQLGIFARRERPKSWRRCSRWEYCNWCSLRSPLSRASFATWWRRNTLFAETILPFARRLRRKRSSSSREKTPKAAAWEGGGGEGGWTTEVHAQGRRRGGSDWCAGQEAAREWWIETKRRLRNPVAVAVRDEGRSELRDPPALRVVIIINLSGV